MYFVKAPPLIKTKKYLEGGIGQTRCVVILVQLKLFTRSLFNKGQSIRDSTKNFDQNKGHSLYSELNLTKIRDTNYQNIVPDHKL